MTKGTEAGRFNPMNRSAFGTRHAKLNYSNLWSEAWPARFGQDLKMEPHEKQVPD